MSGEGHLHIHHHIHVDAEAAGFCRHLLEKFEMITAKLAAAVAASLALAQSESDENAKLKAYIADEPNRSAAAVAAALAAHDVDEDAAADTIQGALDQSQAGVNDSLAALTGSAGAPAVPPADTGSTSGDTPAGGNGDDSVTGAAGDDSPSGGQSDDSVNAGQGSDTPTGGADQNAQ